MIFTDLFIKRPKLVHNAGFPMFEVPYGNQNSVKLIKIP